MTILLYDYCDLEERASRHLNAWKAWHLFMFACAGVFGILNYVFLQNAMAMVNNNCVLYPRELAFRMIDVTDTYTGTNSSNILSIVNTAQINENVTKENAQTTVHVEDVTAQAFKMNDTKTDERNAEVENNVVVLSTNESQRLVLDTSRTLYGWDTDCQFVEYMPILSMIFAATWATMFTMCPGGGYSRSGLKQPWRILAPALVFSLIMFGLTGNSFTNTNKGIQAFCAAFYNVTNTTTCSAAGEYLESSRTVWWSFGSRTSATRIASAGVFASWACAAALFFARCLAAPDFRVRRTTAHLKDPNQIITPYLKKSTRRVQSSSPIKPDNNSIRSEPTVTTELVMASIEHEHDTAPSSLQESPFKKTNNETIEMTTTPNHVHVNGI